MSIQVPRVHCYDHSLKPKDDQFIYKGSRKPKNIHIWEAGTSEYSPVLLKKNT